MTAAGDGRCSAVQEVASELRLGVHQIGNHDEA